MRVLGKHVGNEFGDPVGHRVWIRIQQCSNTENSTVQSSDRGRVEWVTTWGGLRLPRQTNEPILYNHEKFLPNLGIYQP
jgi:hypothetical protein